MERIIIVFLVILIVLQIFIILKKNNSEDLSPMVRELWEFKNSISEIISSKFTVILKENRDNEKTLREAITKSIDDMTQKVDHKLQNIQQDNNQQLEKMRNTVDEKLQNTLEKRLWESFKIVSDRLEQVHKWLGEMQSLAIWVGDLKKVLSNVKTRWILWEIQLENILEQILTPDQYDKNVKTKKWSSSVVEFAIKLPWKEDWKIVYIPVDAKFPLEKYHHLIDAYEVWNSDEIKLRARELEVAVLNSAKDIRDKYIDIPNTTDFGIMFFPIEWLYAEIVRLPWILEKLQKELKVMVCGPTTLVAMLNSLQMWFRTIAIEKRSSEVWNILASVKKEFETFGAVLEKAQRKIKDADKELDNLVWTRTRKMQQKLTQIENNQVLDSEDVISSTDNILEINVES